MRRPPLRRSFCPTHSFQDVAKKLVLQGGAHPAQAIIRRLKSGASTTAGDKCFIQIGPQIPEKS